MSDFPIPPGQPALRRRARTHPQSLAAQRAVLAEPGNDPRVRGLAAQSDAEPAIALLDAFAVVADIVSFYSERLANEGYLRTATERRSVRELARTLGHELRPGVAARTELAFTVEDAPGAPRTALVPAGTPVQSVPGSDEVPQVFETGVEFTAHAAWNAIPAVSTETQVIGPTDGTLWLEGRFPALRRGDALLVVAGETFALRRVAAATVDPPGHPGWTLLTLVPRDDPEAVLGTTDQHVWHLTERGQLFGATSPDPNLLWAGGEAKIPPTSTLVDATDTVPAHLVWTGYDLTAKSTTLEVDGERPAFTGGSWVALEQEDVAVAFTVAGVEASGDSRWGISGKLTRLALPGATDLTAFDRPGALVHGGAVELPAARRPAAALTRSQTLILAPFEPLLAEGQTVLLQGVDADGVVRVEVGTVRSCADQGGTVALALTTPPAWSYQPQTLVVRGNVVEATHGETVTQVLGSGDGRTPFQAFPLLRRPLTHVRATTPSGAAPALEVRVDGVRWAEVDGFADSGPRDRVYRLVREEGAREGEPHPPTSVVFGDGVHGAIPPTGDENIVATYRAGLGAEGALDAGQLSLLVRRPHGVRAVTNPTATVDWAPPETLEEARANAPQRVRTLDRAVSASDFADVARGFAGVGQAAADLVWDGRGHTVVVSVRGTGGADPSASLLADLTTAIDAVRDPRLPFRVLAGRATGFGVAVEVNIDPAVGAPVHPVVRAVLVRDFGATVRGLGQAVTAASVLLTVRAVPGVRYCTMPRLGAGGEALLVARRARYEDGSFQPAEVLVLDPTAVVIGDLT